MITVLYVQPGSCSSVRQAKVFFFVHRLTIGFPYANNIHSLRIRPGQVRNEFDLLRIPLVGRVLRDMFTWRHL